jgi:hypothetical protein
MIYGAFYVVLVAQVGYTLIMACDVMSNFLAYGGRVIQNLPLKSGAPSSKMARLTTNHTVAD